MTDIDDDRPPFLVQQGLLDELDGVCRAAVADGSGYRFVARLTRATGEYSFVEEGPGGARPAFPPTDASMIARRLRDVMHSDEGGTWFTMTLRGGPDSGPSAEFDYDAEPEWNVPIDPIAYATDLDRYPRAVAAQPEWLRERLEQARSGRG